MLAAIVTEPQDVKETSLSYWQMLCPTGGWFWLWKRDQPKSVSLANARAPTAAAVAHHIFTSFMTPAHTHTHIHSYFTLTDHYLISQERPENILVMPHQGRMRKICHQTFLHFVFSILTTSPASTFPFSNAKGCSFISSPSFFQQQRHIYCAQLHSSP